MSSKLVRQAKRLLFGGVIASVGLWVLPVQAQVSDAQVVALVEALRQAAPRADNANEGLTSDWAVKPDNIRRWSRLCTGQELTPQAFSANVGKAREILACVMSDVLRDEYKASGNNESVAVQRAASWWMTGDPSQYNSTRIKPYTQKVLSFYQQQRGNPQAQQPSNSAKPPATQQSAQSTATQAQRTSQPSTQSTQSTARSSSPSPISDNQVRALVEALRDAAQQRAPGKNGLVSEWQILPANIPRWSRLCTGQELTSAQFESNPTKAREILVCVMRDVMRDEYKASGNNESVAVQRAASWWMTGDASRYNSSPTNSYTQNVLSFYQKRRNSQTQSPTTPSQQSTTKPSAQPPTTQPQKAPEPSNQQPSGHL
jgi:hypothetical protein